MKINMTRIFPAVILFLLNYLQLSAGQCGTNQELSVCGTGLVEPFCDSFCDGRSISECLDGPCVNLCTCIFGYVRNYKGNCVLPRNCDVCEGANEEFAECTDQCETLCSEARLYGYSVGGCTDPCIEGCECLENYVRDDATGACIPVSNCPEISCNMVEVATLNKNYCEQTCQDRVDGLAAPTACSGSPVFGCECDTSFGYYRDLTPTGLCASNCDPVICDPGYTRVVCSTPCPQSCDNMILGLTAPSCDTGCRKRCDCDAGTMYKSETNTCVPVADCPAQDCSAFPNSMAVLCDEPCEPTCENNILGITQPASCKVSPCVPGCDCMAGFYRDASNACVAASTCTPVTCGSNEVAVLNNENCETTCFEQDTGVTPTSCPTWSPGCDCAPGFYRNQAQTGACVDGCDITCEQTCSNVALGATAPTPCLADPGQSGCDCKPYYYRDADNICVDNSHCSPCVGSNEVYMTCMPKCYLTCLNKYKPFCPNVFNSDTCISGCTCKDGYYRNLKGKCVTAEGCLSLF